MDFALFDVKKNILQFPGHNEIETTDSIVPQIPMCQDNIYLIILLLVT
jgi:hypothetical protein